ncbi:macrophage migration inhibitory factor homolog isoform X3 [Daktulosphaira vitifoliae]|uniref:macrophage migration inhibitory factor homolog isoform X3 n=1 Tax=Daktulosphaira vitifoliae TaxID=58002 RepID=UPI0021A9DF94|nr:macrophage migration inhibitory factor homolog isoform X3 [Daktulosphaira vitifoliae]XP_050533084.1 macrophage migration inhibitory factor homolog isoform X3 [Daktulosphaira vitifoliae]XP_050533086.1 macrophage migration inhibitory factor homolog isoform X3 [Daktulosphaira vitifoliae]
MYYEIITNLKASQIPEDFLSKTSDFLVELLNIPKTVIMGHLSSEQKFDFFGSSEPCAIMHITRGSVKPGTPQEEDAFERYAKALSEHFKKYLPIDISRLMIYYHEHNVALMGNNGTTFKRFRKT